MELSDFKNYDNAKKAKRVWDGYQEELVGRQDLMPQAISLVEQNRSADNLDLNLEHLLESDSDIRGHSPKARINHRF